MTDGNVDFSMLEKLAIQHYTKSFAEKGGGGYNGGMDAWHTSVNDRLSTIERDLRDIWRAGLAAIVVLASLIITSYLMSDTRIRTIETNTAVIIQKLDDLKIHK